MLLLLRVHRLASHKWQYTFNSRCVAFLTLQIYSDKKTTLIIFLGAYAHVAYREWESDLEVRNSSLNPSNCEDIARQLVLGETGKNFNVIMGGGRSKFLPHYAEDEEGDFGDRLDGVNLIERWLKSKSGKRAKYVWNR